MKIKNKKGFSLLETLLAIGIGTILMTFAFSMMEKQSKDLKDSLFSTQIKIITYALETYTKENYVALRDAAPQVLETSILDLGENYTNSPYGHTYKIVTRRNGQSLETLLIAGDATTDIDPYRIPNISGMSGPKSGYFSSALTGDAQAVRCQNDLCGAYGAWSTNINEFAASGITTPQFASLISIDDKEITAPYLYRDAVPGQPQLNKMNTNLDMGNNSIDRINSLNAQNINTGTITIDGNVIDGNRAKMIRSLYDLKCNSYESISLTDGIPSCVMATPQGAVVGFNLNSCPPGWSDFTPAAGRFLVGVGSNSSGGSVSYTLGETGGENMHTLSIAEMPSHTHWIYGNSGSGVGNDEHEDKLLGNNAPAYYEETAPAGGNAPHENRPPYVAVKYCTKN